MEYAFELALCATLEQSERVVSRQHGGAVVAAGSRIVDICLLEPGPEFDDRAAITDQTIPAPAIEADIGPGEAIPAREAFDIRPDRRADIVERACEVGYLTRERRGGTPLVRATTRYPDDWFGRLVAIENKPDLDRAGDLQSQLRFDDTLGLFDAVVLATESYVTRAHLNRIPDRVGVWRFDPDTGERDVIRQAVPRKPNTRGVEIRDEQPLQTDIAIVSGEAKRRRRRRIAERCMARDGDQRRQPALMRISPRMDGRFARRSTGWLTLGVTVRTVRLAVRRTHPTTTTDSSAPLGRRGAQIPRGQPHSSRVSASSRQTAGPTVTAAEITHERCEPLGSSLE
jgi:hypothetical protein